MKLQDLRTSITSLSGIGPKQEKLFAKLNIFTISDLLSFYSKSYEDRTKKVSIKDFKTEKKIHTICIVQAHQWFGYGKMKTLKLIVNDGTASASLICFNRQFYEKSIPVGSIISVTGNFEVKYGQIQSSSFEITKIKDSGSLKEFENVPVPDSKVFPIYHLTEGLTQKNIRKAINQALNQYLKGIENEIPEELIIHRKLLTKQEAIKSVHEPKTLNSAEKARYSLIYEELFNFQCIMAERAFLHKGSIPEISIEESESFSDFKQFSSDYSYDLFVENLSPLQKQLLKTLSFKLTSDQCNVITQMNLDIDKGFTERSKILNSENQNTSKTPFTMNRLLQGDVGSGKTLVAFFAALRVINWKGQVAIMAPTELLARQHAENAAKLLEPLNIKVAYLTGNIKSKNRNQLLQELKNGNIDILIGTHAIFSTQVIYNDLQLAIIDEQHRFGVVQRQSIIEKGKKSTENGINLPPHLLMMSATPIPQTLALTVFGDLDVSVIKTMPQGRLPVKTHLVREGNEMNAYNAVKKELEKGHQAYFVYPAINSENATQDIKNAEDAFNNLQNKIFPEYKCALIHSKIPQEEQEESLRKFRNGEIQILAATTVIEVGVDVPNATCIVIEMADRFGLAQLHQLRGRVGRSDLQSYCFLIYSNKITQFGIERMKVLHQSTDGFYIANQDLKLRGPGEITGTVQAGTLSLGIADFVRDHNILLLARQDAFLYMKNKLQKN